MPFQAVVGTALESSAAALSNTVSPSAWKPHWGVWLAFKSKLETERLNMGLLYTHPYQHSAFE